MGKRIRLGIIFSVDENWIGGTYYILNLISALGTLPHDKKPFITILSKNLKDFEAAKKTNYPYLDFTNPFDYKRTIAEAVLNKVIKFFTKRECIDKRISPKKIDLLFPACNDVCFERIKNKIYWFPDFQHVYYPDFFKSQELNIRNEVIKGIASKRSHLVLSSEAAKRDWKSLELVSSCKIHVIPFAVSHPSLEDIDVIDLIKEFEIAKDYFIVSNQFWQHKNHGVVLRAAVELKKKGIACHFVFTGKEDDYRNPAYFQSILSFIKDHDLMSTVKILGLIDRRKQLKLMQHAKAVIQPSLFEGWSTVIEDAKSLGKVVIASDIAVHREQLVNEGLFFDPHNEIELVEKIANVILGKDYHYRADYKLSINAFGECFYKILTDFKNHE